MLGGSWLYILFMPLSSLAGVLGTIVTQKMARRTTSGNVGTSDAATVFTNLQALVDKVTKHADALEAKLAKQDEIIGTLRERVAVAEHRAAEAELRFDRMQNRCSTVGCANYQALTVKP